MPKKITRQEVVKGLLSFTPYAIEHVVFLFRRFIYLVSKVDIESLEGALIAATMWVSYRISHPLQHTWDSKFVIVFHSRGIGEWFFQLVFITSVVALFALLEDSIRIRRASSFLMMVFWYWTGGLLVVHFPDYYTPGLHIIMGVLFSWVFIRIGAMAIQVRYSVLRAIERPKRHEIPTPLPAAPTLPLRRIELV